MEHFFGMLGLVLLVAWGAGTICFLAWVVWSAIRDEERDRQYKARDQYDRERRLGEQREQIERDGYEMRERE